jgi:hypothetical protein
MVASMALDEIGIIKEAKYWLVLGRIVNMIPRGLVAYLGIYRTAGSNSYRGE